MTFRFSHMLSLTLSRASKWSLTSWSLSCTFYMSHLRSLYTGGAKYITKIHILKHKKCYSKCIHLSLFFKNCTPPLFVLLSLLCPLTRSREDANLHAHWNPVHNMDAHFHTYFILCKRTDRRAHQRSLKWVDVGDEVPVCVWTYLCGYTTESSLLLANTNITC